MVNKAKAAGTREESAAVTDLTAAGLRAGRHPEGGSKDHGDIWTDAADLTFDGEVKATQTLALHKVFANQRRKARTGAIPFLWWNRRVRTDPSHVRRTSLGRMVVLDADDFIRLLALIDGQHGDNIDLIASKETD